MAKEIISTLKRNGTGDIVYPRTKTYAVLDSDGISVEDRLHMAGSTAMMDQEPYKSWPAGSLFFVPDDSMTMVGTLYVKAVVGWLPLVDDYHFSSMFAAKVKSTITSGNADPVNSVAVLKKLEEYATKSELSDSVSTINTALDAKADSSDVYSRAAVDNRLKAIADAIAQRGAIYSGTFAELLNHTGDPVGTMFLCSNYRATPESGNSTKNPTLLIKRDNNNWVPLIESMTILRRDSLYTTDPQDDSHPLSAKAVNDLISAKQSSTVEDLEDLTARVQSLESVINADTEDADTKINKFWEIVNFLNGIGETGNQPLWLDIYVDGISEDIVSIATADGDSITDRPRRSIVTTGISTMSFSLTASAYSVLQRITEEGLAVIAGVRDAGPYAFTSKILKIRLRSQAQGSALKIDDIDGPYTQTIWEGTTSKTVSFAVNTENYNKLIAAIDILSGASNLLTMLFKVYNDVREINNSVVKYTHDQELTEGQQKQALANLGINVITPSDIVLAEE